jgi:hypothetical protein
MYGDTLLYPQTETADGESSCAFAICEQDAMYASGQSTSAEVVVLRATPAFPLLPDMRQRDRPKRRTPASGAAVVVNCASAKEGADRVVADIKANGGKAIAVKADVTKAADLRRLFAETKKAFDRLDVLVNNAGSTSSCRWKR